jgi:hypothetical protein
MSRFVLPLVAACLLLGCGSSVSPYPGQDSTEVGADPVTASIPVGTVLVTTGDVNLRSGPAKTWSIIEVIPAGDTVLVVTADPSNGFYEVDHDGAVGWCSGKYLELAPDAGPGAEDAGGTGGSGGDCAVGTLQRIIPLHLTHAAFPSSGHPDVAVHVPTGFRPCDHPSLVVYFHGFWNCVVNAMGDVDTPCSSGGAERVALQLVTHFDEAGVNAILVATEIAFDVASGDPGKLSNTGEFRAMLHEMLVGHLDAMLGYPLDVGSFDRIVLASHSGGYHAVADVIQAGKVPIDQVLLFDSLYGYESTYESWVKQSLSGFKQKRRFANVWSTGGGTLDNSESLESSIASALSQAGLSSLLFYDGATSTSLSAQDYAHPIFLKHSGLGHYDIPRHYFAPLLRASGIAPIATP